LPLGHSISALGFHWDRLAPAKAGAGIQALLSLRSARHVWTPAFAGVTGDESVISFGNRQMVSVALFMSIFMPVSSKPAPDPGSKSVASFDPGIAAVKNLLFSFPGQTKSPEALTSGL
jgi:hypothetical protein